MDATTGAIRRLAGASLAHQILIARLLVGVLKKNPRPLGAVDAFEREIMADVSALLAEADDAEGLEIRGRVRDEMAAIVQLLRDGLSQLGA